MFTIIIQYIEKYTNIYIAQSDSVHELLVTSL